MKASSALPYSKKALKSLEELLKVHQSMLWVDPVSNTLSVKQSPESIVAESVLLADDRQLGQALGD